MEEEGEEEEGVEEEEKEGVEEEGLEDVVLISTAAEELPRSLFFWSIHKYGN